MATTKKKDGFILQAGILAAAGILCRIIGILYRSPLTSIIGDEGNGYYSTAYNFYTIILLVSSYSIPSAISKVIAGKLALKEYRNAYRVFKCALLYVVVVGGLASLFTFFCAGFLVKENSAAVLRVFAPTIFLSGVLGVLRGFFQAHGTMMQTSFSQILEQILNAVVSIGAAYGFVSMVERESDTTRAVYGAAGSALGTGVGVLIALLFMLGVFILNRKMILKRVKKDIMHQDDSYGMICKAIIGMVTPIIMSTFIYNFSTSLNQTIYTGILADVRGMAEAEIATMYGIFAGKAVVISNVPIALASAMSAAVIPAVSSSFAVGDKKQVRAKIGEAVHTTMLIAVPSAVGLAVLARPITQLLFPQKASLDQAALLLASISITVVFYSLSTITNGVLQAAGKVNLPVINAAAALVIQTAVLVGLLLYTDSGLYALSVAMITYSFLMCVLNQIAARKTLKYKQELKKTFWCPLLSAVLMGIVAWGSYMGIYFVLPVNAAALAVSILLAGIVYFVTLMALGGVEEEDLRRLPKGYLFVSFGKKCYLLRDPDYVKYIKEEKETKKKTKNRKGTVTEVRRKSVSKNKIETQGKGVAKTKAGAQGKTITKIKTETQGKTPAKTRTGIRGIPTTKTRTGDREKPPVKTKTGTGQKRAKTAASTGKKKTGRGMVSEKKHGK
jgi:stage V sporulation protein B